MNKNQINKIAVLSEIIIPENPEDPPRSEFIKKGYSVAEANQRRRAYERLSKGKRRFSVSILNKETFGKLEQYWKESSGELQRAS